MPSEVAPQVDHGDAGDSDLGTAKRTARRPGEMGVTYENASSRYPPILVDHARVGPTCFEPRASDEIEDLTRRRVA